MTLLNRSVYHAHKQGLLFLRKAVAGDITVDNCFSPFFFNLFFMCIF